MATWAYVFAVFVGVGLLGQRIAPLRTFNADRGLMAFWMGFAGVIIFLQLWHLVMPVNVWAFALVSLTGITGLLWNRKALGSWLRGALAEKRCLFAVLVLCTLWLANRSAGPCDNVDTGLYHLNAIRWNTDYPIIIGLGNLHHLLAMNGASFLYAAMLEIGWWYGRSGHLANGLLLVVLAFQVILAGWRLMRKPQHTSACVFDFLLLTPLLLTAGHDWISSHNSDLAVAVLAFVGASRAYVFLSRRHRPVAEQALDVIFITAVLAAGICIKISLVFFSAACITLLLVVWLVRTMRRQQWAGSVPMRAGLVMVLLLLPWALRGVLLSGRPFYPSDAAAIDVSWAMPDDIVQRHVNNIHYHSFRTRDTSDLHWLGAWVTHTRRDVIVPVVIVILSTLCALLPFTGGAAHHQTHRMPDGCFLCPL